MEIHSPKSINAFNRLEEEGYKERKHNNFMLIDLTGEELYTMEVSAILGEDDEP